MAGLNCRLAKSIGKSFGVIATTCCYLKCLCNEIDPNVLLSQRKDNKRKIGW